MQVRIFRVNRAATQAGRAKLETWKLMPVLPTARRPDQLMGWTSARDTQSEIDMEFPDKDSALAFARKQGWHAIVEAPAERIVRPRNYVDNFKPWIKTETTETA